MEYKNFFEKVYSVVKTIPFGKVTTYGEIAKYLGNIKLSIQVGWALHSNPEPITIPCHRVVNKQGKLSIAFAFGGINVQKQLLLNEGVQVNSDDSIDLNKYFYRLT